MSPSSALKGLNFSFLSMKFLTLNFVGVFFFLIACLLPDIVVVDDEDAKDGDDEVPISLPTVTDPPFPLVSKR